MSPVWGRLRGGGAGMGGHRGSWGGRSLELQDFWGPFVPPSPGSVPHSGCVPHPDLLAVSSVWQCPPPRDGIPRSGTVPHPWTPP